MINEENDTRGLAVFDFDGTITKGDSLLHFLIYSQNFSSLMLKSIKSLWPLGLLSLRAISKSMAKEKIFIIFFRGWRVKRFQHCVSAFVKEKAHALIRPLARKRIAEHLALGHRVAIVSASPDLILQPIADALSVELICTKLEIDNDLITGRFSTPNCTDDEKVKRIKEKFNINYHYPIYAYGNSSADLPMMKIAQHSEFRPFRSPSNYRSLI